MNVSIIIPSLSYGGAERIAQLLGNYLFAHGHNVFFLLTDSRNNQDHDVKGRVVYISDYLYVNSSSEIVKTSLYVRALRRKKKDLRIDVSVSFMEWCNLLNVLSKCHDKVVLSVRTTLSAWDHLDGLIYNKKVIKCFYNLSDLVIAVSEYTKKDLNDNYGIKKEKLITIPNPMILRESISNEAWKYGENAVVCVGRFDPVKQQDRVIKAFSYTHKYLNDAKLILVGDGETRNYLEYIAECAGVKNSVVFVGFTEDVGYYLSQSKVFVLSSRVEGFPNAMIEAMTYSIPIVSTDSPGGCREILGANKKITDVTECEYGVMTPYMFGKTPKGQSIDENEKMLGKAILRLLYDNKLHENYAEKSKKRAMDYEFELIMRKWEATLEE